LCLVLCSGYVNVWYQTDTNRPIPPDYSSLNPQRSS
jgi:hypothetical protein